MIAETNARVYINGTLFQNVSSLGRGSIAFGDYQNAEFIITESVFNNNYAV
jgi:hypothetical protein